MANTKDLTREKRRSAKREARRKNKAAFQALSAAQKRKLRKFEGSFGKFMAQLERDKAQAAQG